MKVFEITKEELERKTSREHEDLLPTATKTFCEPKIYRKKSTKKRNGDQGLRLHYLYFFSNP